MSWKIFESAFQTKINIDSNSKIASMALVFISCVRREISLVGLHLYWLFRLQHITLDSMYWELLFEISSKHSLSGSKIAFAGFFVLLLLSENYVLFEKRVLSTQWMQPLLNGACFAILTCSNIGRILPFDRMYCIWLFKWKALQICFCILVCSLMYGNTIWNKSVCN